MATAINEEIYLDKRKIQLKDLLSKNDLTDYITKQKIVTDGSAVKTGKIIDGKEEYVKRFSFSIGSKQTEIKKALGFKMNEVEITDLSGTFLSNSDNVFAVNSGVSCAVAYDYLVYCNSSDNTLLLRTYNANFMSAKINVFFTYK